MLKPLSILLTRVVRSGHLTFIDSDGTPHLFGDGDGRPIVVRAHDRRLEWYLALDPEMAAGEGYMTGRLTMEKASIYDFIALMMANLAERPMPLAARALARIRRRVRPLVQLNSQLRARENVHHHYDIDPRIYDLFLDPDKQ